MPERPGWELAFGTGGCSRGPRRDARPTLRIVVLADLRGRAGREADDPGPPVAQRRLVPVDVDSFGEVMARLDPRIELRLAGADGRQGAITFGGLDDFRPDRLYRDLEVFDPLRDIRRRLLDASTFADAAAEWSRAVGRAPETPVSASPPAEDDEATARRLLGRGPGGAAALQAEAQGGLDRLLRQIVAPHVVPAPDPRRPELLRSVDEASAALLRSILHLPAFQALEATWRSIHGLVTGLETEAGIELRLLDLTRIELQAECAPDGPSALERLLAREAGPDAAQVWPLLVAGFTFGPGEGDVALLERLGAIARRAGGPVLAAADPGLVGCPSFAAVPDPHRWPALDSAAAARWDRLRASAVAPWIGLAMPRVLLRLPYGARTDPVSALDFEELPSGRDHEAYLWGNPAFACLQLIGASFVENGPAMEPGDHLELEDLPAAVYDDEDGPQLKPCAEAVLSEASARKILDAGVMPLLSSSRRNIVRVMRVQSIAHPPQPLAGQWSGSPPDADR